MPELDERLLQFIWQHRLLKPTTLTTVSGHTVTVLHPGELNRDAGPDFFNAKIRINDLVLAGSIELHLRSSDWLRHGHQHDRSYDRLILHVVYHHDADLAQNVEHAVEVLELKHLIALETIERYAQLQHSTATLPCATQLHRASDLKFSAWLHRMAVARLEHKVKRLDAAFVASGGSYTQVLYQSLFRSFGFSVNALPFELLAMQLPLSILLRHADNRLQVESLLFGMAGQLDAPPEPPELIAHHHEFEFLRKKYQLTPLQKQVFKRSTMRPANFPMRRLAQLSALICRHSRLLMAPQLYTSCPMLIDALCEEDGSSSGSLPAEPLGRASAELVIVNTFAPFFFFYGSKTGQPGFTGLALQLLEACAVEDNRKTRLFSAKKKLLRSAFESQGLIQLHDTMCTRRACLACGIGTELLRDAPGQRP